MNVVEHNAVERGVVGLCRTVLWLSTVVIFVILVANTVLRYATGSSLQWANEVPELLFPWLVMSGVVLAAVLHQYATEGFAPFAAEWQHRHAYQGKMVKLLLPDGATVTGWYRPGANPEGLAWERACSLSHMSAWR